MADTFSREGLTARGFAGFVPFAGIDLDQVPTEPGVYVLLREPESRPRFLDQSPAGWFQGRNPTVPVAELESAWPDGTHCVYIGKAAAGRRGKRHLRKRLTELRDYGAGRPAPHQGGKRIWQLEDAGEFTVAWRTTPDEQPENVEADLLRDFVAEHGKLPIGNRTKGRTR
jgi:hypothetical protein